MECRSSIKISLRSAAVIIGIVPHVGWASWTIEPVDLSGEVGWSLNLGIDPMGTPHAAYFTTNPNGDFHYSRRGEAGWQRHAVIDNADAFALDQNGNRFFITAPAPNFYPNIQVLLDNGLLLGQQLAATRFSEVVFLDFDSQNRPQIGWVDTTAKQLKHSIWTGTAWTTRTVASGSEFGFGNSSFSATLDGADRMHFSWQNEADRLQYAKPSGATWQISSPFPTQNARPFDMTTDTAGNVHLAYDVSTGNVHTGGLFYSLYNGTSWAGGRIPNLDAFGSGRSQVVVDASDEPHIFTYDSTFSGPAKLKHVYRMDGVWTNETLDTPTGNSSGPDSIEAMLDARGMHVLYSTGGKNVYYAFQPAVAALVGDYDENGVVDAADYVVWRKALGSTMPASGSSADGDADGQITQADYDIWRANFGRTSLTGAAASLAVAGSFESVPEPSGTAMAIAALTFAALCTSRNPTKVGARSGVVQ